ncbi:MAG TPA: Nif3-like dinuclear metal center hexameric protein [Vicinamibacterales bacterium]|nr:Nif3-like dinuclear metal center hexameric protein [Vicinamibacterales bacterium]
MSLSRRAFLRAGAGVAGAALARRETLAQAPLTAADVVQRIKDRVGIPWRAQTVDRIVAGSGDTRVRGVATTMMATLEVIQRAAAAGRNLVITHEPTFYSHQDGTEPFAQDAAYRFKDAFLRQHDIAVFRFHDHWHAMQPDGVAFGMARELGWEKNRVAENQREFTFSGIPLAQIADRIRERLGAKTMRVVGDRAMRVNRVAASWGYYTFNPANLVIARPDVDVFVVGETREWETVEYVQDLIASGRKKALIVIGHVASEQAGMKYCAEWLKGFVTEVPVDFMAAAEPFWSSPA